MLRWGRSLLVGAALAGISLSAACGSTVTPGQSALGQQGLSSGLDGTSGAAPSTAAGSAAVRGLTRGVTTVGQPPTANSTAPTAAAQAVGVPASNAPSTRPLQIGFIASACSNCSQIAGYQSPTYSDEQLEQALVKSINDSGGLDGRKIEAYYAKVDTNTARWETDYSAACATFTQDHHVSAVLGYSFVFIDSFSECLRKAGVLWINGGYNVGDAQAFANPLLIASSALTKDALYTVGISSAVQDGWITKHTVFGILREDCPDTTRAFTNKVFPYLKSQGLTPKDDQVGPCAAGSTDTGYGSSYIAGAVLRMRNDGDQLVYSPNAVAALEFALAANEQGYRPKIVIVGGGGGGEGLLPNSTLKNIHGMGWLPNTDIDAQHRPPLNAAGRRCVRQYQKGGLTLTPTNYTFGMIACESFLMWSDSVLALAGDSTPIALLHHITSLGSSRPSAVTVGGQTLLTPTRRSAPVTWQSVLWNDGCNCFLYAGAKGRFSTE